MKIITFYEAVQIGICLALYGAFYALSCAFALFGIQRLVGALV